jgi:5'-nucleotidase
MARRKSLLSKCLLAAALVIFLYSGVASADAAAGDTLRILLTNDDGVGAPGLEVLREALAKEGHRLITVAPSANRSGASVSITTEGSISLRELEPDIWSVDGTPADCVRLAVTRILKEPVDLAISGINFGQNIGAGTISSGTVGAAITATGLGIPSIAISQAVHPEDVSQTELYFPDAAVFVVALVKQLMASRNGGPILPEEITLNVNNPPLHRSALNGVRLTRQGRSTLYKIVYTTSEDGTVLMRFKPSTKREPVSNADTTAIAEGYVSITPLDGSWTAGASQLESLKPLARALQGYTPPKASAAAGGP